MSLLTGSQLAKSYGPDDIFAGIDLALPQGARIGLVGANGAGKTTLLRLLAGLEEPSRGGVQRARGLRLGYLPQEAALYSAGTLWEEMLTAFADLRAREAELARLEAAMADPAQAEDVLERYGALQHQFELDGGYAYEVRIRQVLDGLNFVAADYARPVIQLSGGQKTRALLGRLLLENPDLLILDEPTNHLDIHAVEWLESWLNAWGGAVLIVSHDRYFLDQVVTTIWELAYGRLAEFRGNYSAYLVQRGDREARQRTEYDSQQAVIAKELDYIRRNMAGQNTRQAQGRQRRLERLLAGEDARHAVVDRPRELSQIKLDLSTTLRSGDRVIETRDLAVGYADDGKVLFRAPNLLLWREECAALIGPNGAGKTTFLKTLLGGLTPLSGSVKLGSSLKVGYFAQAHEGLNPARTPLEEIMAAREMPPAKARDYLAKFLFTGDDVFKPIAVLSGGERGRVALAKLALEGANLLLLDEPTNHLDLPSQEILQSVLADFPGTILLVSHDRYLIDGLATQIWSVEAGALEVFKGSWSEYVAFREQAAAAAKGGPAPEPARPGRGARAAVAARPIRAAPAERPDAALKRQKTEERKRAAQLAAVETAIAALEQRLAALSRALEDAGAGSDVERVRALGVEYTAVQTELTARFGEWESLAA
ncbi:MAG: ABC-F family ATP-binding cassette domain-containing protein [Anaerolineales bacterium]|nr:ABC-F family ATP-binding cassette domain-containing protein [Anaerolineales bacterium]